MELKKSKLIETISNLSECEAKKLSDFVKKGTSKSTQSIIKLANLLIKQYPNFADQKLTRLYLYQQIFPSKKYNDQHLKDLMTKLLRIIEDFIIQNYLEQNKEHKQLLLANIFEKRNHPQFQKKAILLKNTLEKKTVKSDNDYWQLHQLHQQLWLNSHTDKWSNKRNYFDSSLKYLDEYYLLIRFQYLLEWKARKNILQEASELHPQYPITIDYIQLKKVAKLPKIQLLNALNNLYDNKGQLAMLKEFKETFLSLIGQLDKIFARSIFAHLINLNNQHINNGNLELVQDTFLLYEYMVDYEILFLNQSISEVDFSNIANLGYSQKKFDWTNQFIKKYQHQLPPKEKEIAVKYSIALKYFYQEQYQKTLTALGNINETATQFPKGTNKDALFNKKKQKGIEIQLTKIQAIRIRALRIRAYFECLLVDIGDYYDDFFIACEAFEKYLRYELKLNPKRIDSYLNFIKILKKLINLPRDSQTIANIQLIVNEKNPALKIWLSTRIKVLSKGYSPSSE